MLKPVNQTELNNTLERVIGKIDEAKDRNRQFLRIDEKLDYYQNLHRLLMFKTVIETPEALKSLTTEEFNRRYGVEFKKPYVCSFIIRLFTEEGAINNIAFFQEKISEDILCALFVDYAVAKYQNGLICHVNLERYQFSELKSNLALMKGQLDKLLYPYDFLSYVIAVGEEALIAENGYVKTTQAAEYTANASLDLSSNLVFYKDIAHHVSLASILKNEELEALLNGAADHLDASLVKKYLDGFLNKAKEIPHYSLGLYEAAEKIVSHIMGKLQKKYSAVYPIQKTWTQISLDIANCRTKKALYELLEDRITKTIEEISKSVQKLENPTITAVKQYVEAHFSEKITLETVADAVYLNSAYLAVLFKKETGITFLDYLTSIRIEKSKALLCDIKLNISQITRAVGYSDSKYFNKLFQKYTGIKPLEYRKLFMNDLL